MLFFLMLFNGVSMNVSKHQHYDTVPWYFSFGSLDLSRNDEGHWETFVVTPPNTERSLQLDHRLKSVKAGAEGGPDRARLMVGIEASLWG